MLKRLSKRSGSRYTFFSIVLIILMLYVFRLSFKPAEVQYPQYVEYGGNKYEYSQTVRQTSFQFVRKYGISYEGNVLLLKRGERNKDVPEKVYIFLGWRQYREYVLMSNQQRSE